MLDAFGELENGAYHVQVGRTTNVTAGICNGTLAFCNWVQRDQIHCGENGNEVRVASDRTEEYVIVDKQTEQRNDTQSSFCAAGDSDLSFLTVREKYAALSTGGCLVSAVLLATRPCTSSPAWQRRCEMSYNQSNLAPHREILTAIPLVSLRFSVFQNEPSPP